MPTSFTGVRAIASSTNATPIAVTFAAAHGLLSGATIAVTGHLVNTAANGQWVVTVTSGTTLTLTGSVGNGVGGATGNAYTFPTAMTLPSDGDVRDASSVAVPFEGLQSAVQYLKNMMVFPAFSVTRVLHGSPVAPAADWTPVSIFSGDGLWNSHTAGTFIYVPAELPHGAIWTGVTATVKGNASPAVPITVKAARVLASTGVGSTPTGLGAVSDGAPSTSAHTVTLSGGTSVVDRSLYRYGVEISSEDGAGAGTSYVYAVSVTYTVTQFDVGAA